MRRALLASALLPLALAPAAAACTIDNCVEVRRAAATWNGDDLHSLDTQCVAAGRGGQGFAVVAEVTGHGEGTGPETVSVRCTAYLANGTVVYDDVATATGPAAVLAGSFVSGPNVRVCVHAEGWWPDGHYVDIADCS